MKNFNYFYNEIKKIKFLSFTSSSFSQKEKKTQVSTKTINFSTVYHRIGCPFHTIDI